MAESDEQQLRAEVLREIADAEASRAETAEALARTAGGGREAFAVQPSDAALGVLRDRGQPAELRVTAMSHLTWNAPSYEATIEALLGVLEDAGDDAAVRQAALRTLSGAAFATVQFAPFEQPYVDALRTVSTGDPNADLRAATTAVLAVRHDPDVQQRLVAGLKGQQELPVPRAHAIQLLAEDDHQDVLPWLDELVQSDSPAERQEAVRLMSAHPAAQERLEATLLDKAEDPVVRQQSAASLRNIAPERFDALARQIVDDDDDDADVRAAARHTLDELG